VANVGYMALENALKSSTLGTCRTRCFRGIRGSVDGTGKGIDRLIIRLDDRRDIPVRTKMFFP